MGKAHNIAGGTILAVTSMLGALEHRELVAYRDIGGVTTFCDGIVRAGVKVGDKFTKKQCDDLSFWEIRDHIKVIDKYVNVDLTQTQLEALILFVHNVGETQFRNSTALKRFNAGDIHGGCEAMLWFNRVHGQIVTGLVNRREAEHKLCVEGMQ